MPKYKNIIFDLGGVLLDIDYDHAKNAFEALGVRNFDQLYNQSRAGELFRELEVGNISPSGFHRQFNDQTGLNLSADEIDNAWNKMLLGFRESSLKYLEYLRSLPQVQLMLLSNTNSIHYEKFRDIYHFTLRQHPFEAYFTHCFYSFEIGLRKPDIGCYQWVLNRAAVNPEETIFIDDSPENISAAAKTGINAILLEKGTLIEELGLEDLVSG